MIRTVEQLINTLGGLSQVAQAAGVTTPAVCNWRERKRIPPDKFLAISEAVEAKGGKVSPLVFGFKETSRERT